MNRYIVDASVVVDQLLGPPLKLESGVDLLDALLAAPELVDAEVLSALRKNVQLGLIEPDTAQTAVDDLPRLHIERISHRHLTSLAWQYRHNVSAYDALYVAASRLYGYPLITGDGPLSRAPGLDITVQHVHTP